jgi:hypothetical protein
MRPNSTSPLQYPSGWGADATGGIRMSSAREGVLLGGGDQIGVRLRTRSQREIRRDADGETTAWKCERARHVRAMTGVHILRVDDPAAVIDRGAKQEFQIR